MGIDDYEEEEWELDFFADKKEIDRVAERDARWIGAVIGLVAWVVLGVLAYFSVND